MWLNIRLTPLRMCRRIGMDAYGIVTGTSSVIMTWNNTRKHFFKRPAFLFLEHAQDLFKVAACYAIRGKGLSGHQPPLAKSFKKYYHKKTNKQAFKSVLDLTLSKRGAQEAWQFNSFNDFRILEIYGNYSYGLKTCETWLKWS